MGKSLVLFGEFYCQKPSSTVPFLSSRGEAEGSLLKPRVLCIFVFPAIQIPRLDLGGNGGVILRIRRAVTQRIAAHAANSLHRHAVGGVGGAGGEKKENMKRKNKKFNRFIAHQFLILLLDFVYSNVFFLFLYFDMIVYIESILK